MVGVVGQPDRVALDAQLHVQVRLVLVGDLVEQLGQRGDGVAVRLVQRVDRPAQLLDGVLRQLLGGREPAQDRGPGSAERLGLAAGDLDGHPGGEDVLRDAVVQLAGDPVPLPVDQLALVGQQQPLLDLAQLGGPVGEVAGLGGGLVVQPLGAAVQGAPAWYCSEVCNETAAWLARIRSTDRSPGSGSTWRRCCATRLPTVRPSSVIGTRIQPDGSITGRVWPARIDCELEPHRAGQVALVDGDPPSPSEARNRGRAPRRWPSASASTVHSAFRCAAAARTTSSSSPRGPSTVRTSAREIESIARTACCIRSSERT